MRPSHSKPISGFCARFGGPSLRTSFKISGGAPLDIVHRDVSPSEHPDYRARRVKLLDFGIAKVQGSIAETQHGIIKGKARMRSPEQCMGNQGRRTARSVFRGRDDVEALAGKRRPPQRDRACVHSRRRSAVEIDIAETLLGVPLPARANRSPRAGA